MQYIVKNESGTFNSDDQPVSFKALSAIENRLFICECDETPNGEFVVEFPEDQQRKLMFYVHANGKKLPFDPFKGLVTFGTELDNKNRRTILYTAEQVADRLAIMKWLMLNVWIPDKARMYSIPTDIVQSYIDRANSITDDVEAKNYINKNLYYNL